LGNTLTHAWQLDQFVNWQLTQISGGFIEIKCGRLESAGFERVALVKFHQPARQFEQIDNFSIVHTVPIQLAR